MFAKEFNAVNVKEEMILDADAMRVREMIQQAQITSTMVTQIYSEHIDKVNPTINSIVEKRFQKASEEAEYADTQVKKGKASGKLFGVPISLKESFYVKGMQTTGGLVRRRGKFAKQDAEVVRKLKQEGAIILGKSNVSELDLYQEADNKLYGKTNNPRDLSRTAGGSSGGEAATIAIGGAAAGLGSDLCGSIRIPCHFNGVVGFKSGKGQVSDEGSYPKEKHPLQRRMLGIGPITKSVRDAELIYRIIAKEEPEQKSLADFTINILPSTLYPLSAETSELLDISYNKLREGFYVERKEPPYMNESATLWQEIMSIDGAKMAMNAAFKGKSVNLWNHYLKEVMGGTARNHRYLLWSLIGASIFKPSKERVNEIRKKIALGDVLLDQYLSKRILLFPVYHTSAPKHGTVYSEIFSIRKTFKKYMPYLAYANVWGLPSLTVPVGKDEEGMPIALQLMSKVGNEDALFQLGKQFEKEFQGYERAL